MGGGSDAYFALMAVSCLAAAFFPKCRLFCVCYSLALIGVNPDATYLPYLAVVFVVGVFGCNVRGFTEG